MSNFYKDNNKEYIISTINQDMSYQYNIFEGLLNNSKNILDLGFGSGRDSLYFSKKYNVYSLDNVEEFCIHGKELGLKNVICMNIVDLDYKNYFDGIWACASLLHLKYDELIIALNKCYDALRNKGIMYASFKYGTFEGIRDNRYYLDLDIDKLNKLLSLTRFKLFKTEVTNDVRSNNSTKWLNIYLEK